MDLRGRPLLFGAVAVALTGTLVVAGASPSIGAVAPGSLASAITTDPVRPAACTTAQINALNIDNCALYANGTPADHGFPSPPFPGEEIVTTPITAEQWVPITIGASGAIVVLLQRALRTINPLLLDDGQFGNVTAGAVRIAQTNAGLEPNAIVDAVLAAQLGILVTATKTFPGPGWVYNGNTYTGSPILAEWEGRLVDGAVRAEPDISPIFEGFLADLRAGSLRVDEKSAYGFRCVATSTRNCAGLDVDQLSYHAWGAAMDVNWSQNPLQGVSSSTDVCGATTELAMPDWVIKVAQHWGLYWGGWYGCPKKGQKSTTKDPHHFEFRGSPDLARRIVARNSAPGAASPPIPGVGDLLLNCGDRGGGVASVRALLGADDRPTEADDLAETFTPALAGALVSVQARHGLPQTGAFDPATATALGVTVRHSEAFPVLHMNSCGPAVDALQRALGIAVSGTFGSSTLAKLRTWQRAHGLGPSGVTNTATAAALGLRLEGATGGGGGTTTTTSTTSTTTTTTVATDPTAVKVIVPLKQGNRNASVKALQTALTKAGYKTPVTGSFGAVTSSRLKRFKRDHGLPVTSTLTIAAAQQLGLAPMPKVPTRYGERGEHVLLLQQALRALGFSIAADGRFGPGTRQALRTFQADHQLKVTGALDAKTAKALGW